MNAGSVRILKEVKYILEFMKNLISLCTLHENYFSYRSNGDMHIMKVSKGVLFVTRERRTEGNIYKLLGNIVVGDVASVEFDKDATKLWHTRLVISVSVG